MWQTIQTFIETNPTLTAIYSGAIGGSLFYYCRNIFTKVFNALDRMVSFDLQSRVLMKDNYLQESLLRLIESSKCLYKKDYELNWENNVQSGFGTSWYIVEGKLLRMYKSLDQNTIPVISISLKVYFCWNKEKWLERIINKIKTPTNPNKIEIYSDYGWGTRTKRFLNTIYLKDNIGYNILYDLKMFLRAKDFYSNYSIPYKRNYLLYGKPGTGKTSLILALASELGRNIVLINLNKMSDIRDISRAIKEHVNDSIIVFEDIDAQTNLTNNRGGGYIEGKPATKRNDGDNVEYKYDFQLGDYTDSNNINLIREEVVAMDNGCNLSKLTLSQLLNLFDGLQTIEEMICIFTTNHIEKLDPAFLRKGRMDYIVEIPELDLEQALKMIHDKLSISLKDFSNETEEYYKDIQINPAELQEIWMSDLKEFNSREETLKLLKDLFENAKNTRTR